MMSEVFVTMRLLGMVRTQEDFSVTWLGKSPSYYSAITAMGREPSVDSWTWLSIRLDEVSRSLTIDCFASRNPALDQKCAYIERLKTKVSGHIRERCRR